ncbi:MAG: calcium-binding protein [Hyphomicrobiales bacterium]|nr:MAG: calcium-binding protein [Hyphomicrobiales bacterium]
MPKILNTNGNSIINVKAWFETFDIIRYSASELDRDVALSIIDRGRIDLSSELGTVAVSVSASAKGNTLITGAGDDILAGGVSNDTLVGRLGADFMLGGKGDDTYVVDALDTVAEVANEGTDTVRSSVRWELGDNIENLTLTGDAKINGFGNELANILTGNSNYNYLNGFGGRDTLIGGGFDDYYELGDTTDIRGALTFDRIIEKRNAGIDTVSVAADVGHRTYVMDANVENVVIVDDGEFNIVGNKLDNVIRGSRGRNLLEGKGGDDTLHGFSFDDILDGGSGNDELFSFKTGSCRFSTPLDAKSNVDTIYDPYGPLRLELSQAIFASLPAGDLQDKYFVQGTAATTADHHLIFEPYTDRLYYDADGIGGEAQVLFARLPDTSGTFGADEFHVY